MPHSLHQRRSGKQIERERPRGKDKGFAFFFICQVTVTVTVTNVQHFRLLQVGIPKSVGHSDGLRAGYVGCWTRTAAAAAALEGGALL